MIAKGKIRGAGAQLARYLMTGEKGEVAELAMTRGLDEYGDPVLAFDAFEQIAEANTRSTKPFFHGHIRLAPGEQLADGQWMEAFERMEQRLGFSGQPCIVSFHTDLETGEKHLHAAWFRVDLETMQAIDPGLYKNHLMQLSRTLEREFELREVSNTRQPDDRARAANQNEYEESKRLEMDVRAIRTAILDCLEHADSGRAFKAALEERSLMLANGDRRDCFVVIDEAGGHHALNKKLTGMTLAEIRERLADLDRTQLPGVEQAQALQREQHHQHEIDRAAEQEMQAARAAAQGRVDDIRPLFDAAASHVTEPAAPIYDRDAASRAADEKIIDAAIAAAKGRADDIRPADSSADRSRDFSTQEAVQTPEASAAPLAPGQSTTRTTEPESGLRDADHIVTRILGGVSRMAEKFFDFLGDMIAPAPPPTPDQAERMVRSAEEKQQAHAEQAAHQERNESQYWLVEEARRQAAKERGEAERAKTAAERFGTPRAQEWDDDRDRGYERER